MKLSISKPCLKLTVAEINLSPGTMDTVLPLMAIAVVVRGFIFLALVFITRALIRQGRRRHNEEETGLEDGARHRRDGDLAAGWREEDVANCRDYGTAMGVAAMDAEEAEAMDAIPLSWDTGLAL